MYDDKYIVVTGGAGFIGSCVVRQLNEMGMKNIIIVDELGCDEKWKNLVGKSFIDFIDKEDFFTWAYGKEEDIEAFIHLGACSSTVETDCHYLLENNYRFSVSLAEYAIENGHRFIYASSAATYGDGSLGFSDNHADLEKFRPLNMYGYSKHLFDLWLKNQNLLDKVVGLKYFNVFGPNEYHKGRMASALLKMVPDVLTHGTIKLFKSSEPEKYKDGDQVRDFLYVKDAAKITVSFLTNDLTGIYNVGSGVANTWNELAKAVFEALQKEVRIEYIEMPQDLLGKYQNYTKADLAKSKKAGVLAPAYSLKEGVIDYVRNYLVKREYL